MTASYPSLEDYIVCSLMASIYTTRPYIGNHKQLPKEKVHHCKCQWIKKLIT